MANYQNLILLALCITMTTCLGKVEEKKNLSEVVVTAEKAITINKDEKETTQEDTLYSNVDTLLNPVPMQPFQNSKDNLAQVLQKIQRGDSTLIVCYGNSITNGYKVGTTSRVDRPYPKVLEELLQAHFKNPHVKVQNQGHNGWRSREALQNLTSLVIRQKPDLVLLKFGINDAYSSISVASFEQNMRQIISLLKQQGIAVLLLRTSPINTPYEAAVSRYAPVLVQLAQEEKAAFFDLHTALLKRMNQEKIALNIFLPDEVHLADEYYPWIADAIFEFLTKK